MPYSDNRAIEHLSTAALFTALMLNIWGAGDSPGDINDPSGNEADLTDFYQYFHNALETARALGARTSEERDYDLGPDDKGKPFTERVVDVAFRDGSSLVIGVAGGTIHH